MQSRWLYVLLLGLLTLAWASAAPSQDILLFSYDDSTPFPNSLKCFTCTNKSSNHECNRKAYDMFCPRGTKFCHTSHHVNEWTGQVVINKKCAIQGECTPNSVGCGDTDVPGVKRCVSCCDWNICNSEAPSNSSTAIYVTTKPKNGVSSIRTSNILYILYMISIIMCRILVRT
ncbi:ly6/PLAUR domain-containing protein 6-like [Anneissia japonica]|uniref:ly6/PLAUR domain-containing protein 6-like n=1 Tax=Anneissia japonica TaxID=1529436 RepID=UPI0014258C6A|nr:ly6/PLAUR domain-containing protein 6-like [Anneissia japonica]XP_033097695.1 ly6/PLAUR domain-containing protein 6-like [Anneissia japonica]XP_033097705.1 ly6/PLAUR domain-containing protein 6-like [Anneissia japonica]XP_033097710.1 ly6/PLAUR domain-containing protein 6-like [Anneissia japonica]XP_033097719.1 ly6/PLAUR domain-containing protein 6-like [Anneissia japonica]XP_033097726.1 ly6/PLAUR domain-containing protein 6-like [Anneissia japonica]XP_033097734.1 ly6/PLAUR domain-containin